MTYLDPRLDLVFKKLFSSEENKDLLIDLINAIVSEKDQVVDVEVLNPYNVGQWKDEKLSILDIKVRDKKGQYYLIEMQLNDTGNYDKRALYYWAKTYSSQLKQGEKYAELRKTIGIHILNFVSIPDNENYHSRFYLKEDNSNHRFSDDIEIHTIELQKFARVLDKDIEQINQMVTSLERWSIFLTKWHDLAEPRFREKIKGTPQDKALDVLERISLDKEEQEIYDVKFKWYCDEASFLHNAEQKGLQKGREEEKLEIAKKMLDSDADIDFISDVTGLSIDEINKLK